MLRVDPKKRLCGGPDGFLEFQRHPIFNGIEWKKLEQMQCPSPFTPDTERANFERGPDIEEMFETDSADLLKYRRRKTIDPSVLSPMRVKMENDYIDFNYEKYTPPTTADNRRLSIFDSCVDDVDHEASIEFDTEEN